MKKVGKDAVTPFINIEHQLITFTPTRFGAKFTDPSYHCLLFMKCGPDGLMMEGAVFGGSVPREVVSTCIRVFIR